MLPTILPHFAVAFEAIAKSRIKRMKSRKYYHDLKKYPEIFKKLKDKYKST